MDLRETAAIATADPRAVRLAASRGRWRGTTRLAAPGYVQCNLVVLPGPWAERFADWCEANRSVAPILARGERGDPRLPSLGQDLDVRTDLPAYRVLRDGVGAGASDLLDVWADDLVAFAFGCSFSLEEVLRRAGVPLAYEQRGFGGAIYETSEQTAPAGGFSAPLVVSMRPLPRDAAQRAVAVSRRFPKLHGAPVRIGDPAAIGVDLARPLEALGEVELAADETPVFWACGVTTQFALERARPPLALTHRSAHMLVTDVRLDDL